MRRDYGYAVVGVLVLVLLVAVLPLLVPTTTPGTGQVTVTTIVDTRTHVDRRNVTVPANSSALTAFNQTHELAYTTSPQGAFMTGIDGVTANETHYWIYLVNGEPASVAVDRYRVARGDVLSFRYLTSAESQAVFE